MPDTEIVYCSPRTEENTGTPNQGSGSTSALPAEGIPRQRWSCVRGNYCFARTVLADASHVLFGDIMCALGLDVRVLDKLAVSWGAIKHLHLSAVPVTREKNIIRTERNNPKIH